MKPINSSLRDLIEEYKKMDHWVGLDNIVEMAQESAENIDMIANSFEKIAENRKQLPVHLVKLMVYIEIAKDKLSIMSNEWNETVDKVIPEMIKDIKPNFDDMDF